MKILLISPNTGVEKGGEAIKVFQYFKYLLENGYDAHLVTHARCRSELNGVFPDHRVIFVEDSIFQKVLWYTYVFRELLDSAFERRVGKMAERFPSEVDLVHYLCPISPVRPRFPVAGYRVVYGPLSGNIFHPPAFSKRMSLGRRVSKLIHIPLQKAMGRFTKGKKVADAVLVSGGERTRQSLRAEGVTDRVMKNVLDSGVDQALVSSQPIRHQGTNGNFVFIGRLVEYKGVDLAIRSLALSSRDITLTIFGDGPKRSELEQLAKEQGLSARVNFAGWLQHGHFSTALRPFRGMVFPTLAEANGIVMQEAMAIGLPVITLRWGGPSFLASDSEAIFVDPESEEHVLHGLAENMMKLCNDPNLANRISECARRRAENHFTWPTVAESWVKEYYLAPERVKAGSLQSLSKA